MFVIRRLLWIAAIPVVLFLGASAALEPFAESQLASGMRSTLGLGERPHVQIESFPILLRVVQGRIPRILIDARTVVIEGLEIDRLTLDMHGVETSIDALIRRNRFELTVERGEGAARISERAINAFLEREEIDVVVAFRPDGSVAVTAQAVVGGRRRTFVATGTLTLGGRTLTFKPGTVTMDGEPVPQALRPRARRETTFSVEIPKLPAEITPSEVRVSEGEMALVANFEGFVLRVL